MLRSKGIDEVLDFARKVESSRQVGSALGIIGSIDIDSTLLPRFLASNEKKEREFINAYIFQRHYDSSWAWCDGIAKSTWSNEQIAFFLNALPYCEGTWVRSEAYLKDNERLYWATVDTIPDHSTGENSFAIDKLIHFDRPYTAIDCLVMKMHLKKGDVDARQCIRALIAGLSTKENIDKADSYNVKKIIKYIQQADTISINDKIRVEWGYLRSIYDETIRPRYLEEQLSSNPEVFCKVIELAFHSRDLEVPDNFSRNLYQLLGEWKHPPGLNSDGTFNIEKFKRWIESVIDISNQSGFLSTAMYYVGEVLIYVPADPDGLWIARSVAEFLDREDMERARHGFHIRMMNSRGAHFVDPTGKAEDELAESFEFKSEQLESTCYLTFSATLKSIADEYRAEAEYIRKRQSMQNQIE